MKEEPKGGGGRGGAGDLLVGYGVPHDFLEARACFLVIVGG